MGRLPRSAHVGLKGLRAYHAGDSPNNAIIQFLIYSFGSKRRNKVFQNVTALFARLTREQPVDPEHEVPQRDEGDEHSRAEHGHSLPAGRAHIAISATATSSIVHASPRATLAPVFNACNISSKRIDIMVSVYCS